MRPPLARIRDATVFLGRRRILENINLTVNPGEFWTLIGPNGAGKSTLLGLFNGLTPCRTGSVTYNGRPVTPKTAPRIRPNIAHVFQATDIDPKMPMNVFEAVLAGTYSRIGLLGKPGKREKDLAARALEAVGLSALAGRPIGRLSGGEGQRMALARALTQEPEFLLLDEPTASLDWQARREVLNTIDNLRRRYRLAVFLVTHDLNAVFSMAANVAMLKGGRLVWCGPVDEAVNPELLGFLYSVPITIAACGERRVALF
ncbi:MAG: metal ABC transporter ATP-binding protein [Desulfovibrio sp.]|jgi:ABC-type cobalamin/Fe3+-siderophores transport system ATPase subunit|nr:metal ABC transporter ATP-binding protein [Desulfovibrio sp.]